MFYFLISAAKIRLFIETAKLFKLKNVKSKFLHFLTSESAETFLFRKTVGTHSSMLFITYYRVRVRAWHL